MRGVFRLLLLLVVLMGGLSIVIGTGSAGTAGVARFVGLSNPSFMSLGPYVLDTSLRIENSMTRRGDIATMKVVDVGNQLAIGRFSKLRVIDDQGVSQFTGWVTKIKGSTPSAAWRTYDLTCQDATFFLTSRIHNKVYTNQFVTDIARDMVLNAVPPVGITANNTIAGTGYVIPYFTVSRGILANELTRLAKIASVGLIWDWFVDDNFDLHFFYASQAPAAPIVLTDVASPAAGYYNYLRPTFFYETDDSQLGTNVTVRGGTFLSGAYTQTWVANGNQTSFPLDYAPDTTSAATFPTLTVGGTSKTVSVDKGGTPTTQWLVSQDPVSKGWVMKVGTDGTPANTVVVQTIYQYDLPLLTTAKNWNQISILSALPNQGIFDRYIYDSSILSKVHAHQRATAELSMYGQSYVNAHADIPNISTGAGGISTLGPGQIIPVVNNQLGVNTKLLIVKQTITAPAPQLYSMSLDLQG